LKTVIRTKDFDTSLGRAALAWNDDPGRGARVAAVVLPAHTPSATLRALHDALRARGAAFVPSESSIGIDAPAVVLDAIDAVRAATEGCLVDGASDALDWSGIASFRRAVYERVLELPRGAVTTYGAIARELGAGANASRAVGRALATNPWPLLVPCHRVVGGDGELQGYSAPGGVRTKALLLTREGLTLDAEPARASRVLFPPPDGAIRPSRVEGTPRSREVATTPQLDLPA